MMLILLISPAGYAAEASDAEPKSFEQVGLCGTESIPRQYIAAIESQSADKMANFLTDAVHYSDPTMVYFGGDPIDISGRTKTVEFWRKSFQQSETTSLSYNVESCFAAGATVILTTSFRLEASGSAWQVNTPAIVLQATHIMIVRIENNLIAAQTDYVDYNAINHQVTHLQKKFGLSKRN